MRFVVDVAFGTPVAWTSYALIRTPQAVTGALKTGIRAFKTIVGTVVDAVKLAGVHGLHVLHKVIYKYAKSKEKRTVKKIIFKNIADISKK